MAVAGRLRAVLTFTVRPGDAEEFENAWREVADWTRAWPGCIRQTLSLAGAADEEIVYVITSDWSDESSFRSFERSEEQDVVTAGLRRLRRSSRMELQRVVAERLAAGVPPI
ncbi:antibiotic biosynthesis monooxygenase [Microbispora sp. RL4-1S]|uniref:Antibiotic biosynthesis monooxygenase n=1 Tax=Microbispora oryzae TaxID=2806554 RepID=A0A940WNQ6_9ACTN|nr:antibiotic biosynthesis monooxygenase family protein [Microbispora oryzae]MBP2708278.1 antibiotic biosynthesis monooxygenase [Microbispora oryzae]